MNKKENGNIYKDVYDINDKLKQEKMNDKAYYDGWVNTLLGLGTKRDKTYYSDFKGIELIPDITLAELWAGDGFGKRIIEVVADDMTREWITVENDSENKIFDDLERLNAEANFNLAKKWSRLFGGSIIVMGLNDGRNIEEPVNVKAVKSIDYLKVFNRAEIAIYSQNYNTDLLSPNYGELTSFYVVPRFGVPFTIHTDRCLIFKGIPVPTLIQGMNFFFWGMSALQPIWTQLKDFGVITNLSTKILQEFIIGKYKIKDLAQLMANKEGEAKLKARMNIIDLSKSVINGVLLDSEEDYERDSANITGLPEILDRFMMFLSGVSGVPVTRLFGRSAAGMNATGEGDLKNYYDMIKAMQKNELKPQLQKLVNIINQTLGNKINKPTVQFNSLYQLTEKEKADIKNTYANIDKIYLDEGVLTSEDVAEARFVNGFNYDINIESYTAIEGKGGMEANTEPEAPIIPDPNYQPPVNQKNPPNGTENNPYNPLEPKIKKTKKQNQTENTPKQQNQMGGNNIN